MIDCRLVPESTRWLRMKGRLNEAMALFTKMARVNGREVKNKELQLRAQSHQKISRSTIADLFQPASVAIYTIIQGAAWCVFSFSILISLFQTMAVSHRRAVQSIEYLYMSNH